MTIINNFNFEEVSLIKILIERNPQSALLATFKEVFYDTKEILANRIPKVFDQYTIHDIGHSLRIMDYMYNLIDNPHELSDLEIIILCYAALLHDIGMAVTDEDIILIKQDKYSKRNLKYSSFLKLHKGDEKLALQEYVRIFHAERSNDYIIENLKNELRLPNHLMLSFWKELGLICQSHNEDFDWIESNLSKNEIRGKESFNPQYCACLLRLSDILDIDDQRTPYKLYDFIKPSGFSNGEWKQHYLIYNYDKISKRTSTKIISFFGHCDNPKVHRRVLSYFGWVSSELKGCLTLTNSMAPKYQLSISENIVVDIRPEGYTFSDSKVTIDFKAVTSLLIGEKIYEKKQYGLRELIQNGLDACAIRKEEEIKMDSFGYTYAPAVRVIINKKNNIVIIKDNGVGMTLSTIKNHFLNVGSSY